MTPSQISLLFVTVLGGICVLVSYYICFFKLFKPQNYIQHDLWFNMPESYRYTAICFQILAVVGFLRLFVYFISHTPSDGILSYGRSHMIWIIMLFFLLSSALWPLALYYKQKVLTVLSLLIAASACVLLLAGCVETKAPLDVMLGAFFLSIVCVLQDAVMWNASYLIH